MADLQCFKRIVPQHSKGCEHLVMLGRCPHQSSLAPTFQFLPPSLLFQACGGSIGYEMPMAEPDWFNDYPLAVAPLPDATKSYPVVQEVIIGRGYPNFNSHFWGWENSEMQGQDTCSASTLLGCFTMG